jgi:hypothetical protein
LSAQFGSGALQQAFGVASKIAAGLKNIFTAGRGSSLLAFTAQL